MNSSPSFEDQVNRFRGDLIQEELMRTKGNKSEAARNLKMHRNTLIWWLRRLGVKTIRYHRKGRKNGNE